jgi:drug/metabolite transporter (DMT)-like permease
MKHGYSFAIAAILLWSTVSTAFKIALRFQTPAELLAWSSLFSLVILLAICFVTRERIIPSSRREWFASLILGGLNPFLYYTVLFEAYHRLRAQEAQTLNYTWAIVLVLLSAPILKQRLHARDLLAVGLGFLGALIIALQGNFTSFRPDNPVGVALALSSSLLWALYWLFNLRDTRNALPKLTVAFLFGTVFSIVALGFREGFRVPEWQGIAGAAYVGAFEMGITFVLWMEALRRSPNPARVSVLIYLTPFLSLVIINRILGEAIRWPTLIGLCFIVIGILSRFRRVSPPEGL